MRPWERIYKTFTEDLQGFMGIHEDSRDFGIGFVGIHKTLGEDLQGFMRLRGFMRICETLAEDLQDFGRGFERIHKDL